MSSVRGEARSQREARASAATKLSSLSLLGLWKIAKKLWGLFCSVLFYGVFLHGEVEVRVKTLEANNLSFHFSAQKDGCQRIHISMSPPSFLPWANPYTQGYKDKHWSSCQETCSVFREKDSANKSTKLSSRPCGGQEHHLDATRNAESQAQPTALNLNLPCNRISRWLVRMLKFEKYPVLSKQEAAGEWRILE